ncbi:MAG: ATP-binding cassette domain-containing protein [Solobacterium sp.]|nr:ATP-binding cassette domain-containing protein [Solobacterium sp.]
MLKIENLYKSFKDKDVLKGLELQVEDGSIFGLVGVNGAGKSTLLRLIAGVYRADGGRIELDGKDTYLEEEARGRIAFVSDEQYWPIGSTVGSLKLLYETMYGFDEEAYRKYLDVFALKENMVVTNLSKGNKRRLALLFALSVHPKLLLLDEAYDGLEPLARHRFKQILTELIEDEGISVIISSHNLKELEDICDSFGILEDGRIVSYGDLLQSKEHLTQYQVVFKEEPTENAFDGLEILHKENEGRVYRLVIRGKEEDIVTKLNGLNPVLLDVLQVNFEELFIYELESRGTDNE